MLTCVSQNFLEDFIESSDYYVILLKYFFCLEYSRTVCECILRPNYVVVVTFVVVRSDRVFRKLYRKRELQLKIANFKKRRTKL